MWVAGIDGCRSGWIVVLAKLEGGALDQWRWHQLPNIGALAALTEQPRWVALDIPIGLFEQPRKGGRLCDQAVRRALGIRRSSVFSPPARVVFPEKAFRSGLGLSLQGFHIMPKIREVDAWMDPTKQERVFEAHPEWSFCQLAGRPMTHPKKKRAGFEERLRVLQEASSSFVPWQRELGRLGKGIARDDLMDACVLVHTARRRAMGLGERAPADPPRDERGLLMEIWS